MAPLIGSDNTLTGAAGNITFEFDGQFDQSRLEGGGGLIGGGGGAAGLAVPDMP